MSDVLEFAGVSVVRGGNTLLDDITWEVEEGQRWVILGPNGAGKTTLLQLAAGRIHPTTGVAGVLGEVLGAVDVFELRPRIGLSSAVIAERLSADELVRDVVVTASYGIVGRWRESYDDLDHARAAKLLEALGAGHLSDRTFGTLSEGERKRVALEVVREHGVDPDRPSVVFVGRITRQKGLPYLLRAAAQLPPEVQLVLCAGSPDTPQILAEVEALIGELRQARDGVVWIAEMLPRAEIIALLSAATVFACPSVYEPLGIVNLEAMACELPVVATATGGIPEVVVDGETGWLVPIEQVAGGSGTPADPEAFVSDLAAALIDAVSDPARARAYGQAGRERAVASFSWSSIGDQTMAVYDSVLKQ